MQQEHTRQPKKGFALFAAGKPYLRYAIYAGIALLAVLLYWMGTDRFSCAARASPKPETSAVTAVERDDLEERLIAVLSKIRGAGRVEVLVAYESSGEIVTAMSSRTDEDLKETVTGKESSSARSATTVTEPATVKGNDGQEPIILSEREPVVRGVIVVAEGAAQVAVRKDLQNAVRAVTGVSLAQIEVFEMTANEAEE